MVSGVIGLILAMWGKEALTRLLPMMFLGSEETSIDGWVLAFTFGISARVQHLVRDGSRIAGARKCRPQHALKQSGSRNADYRRRNRMRNALVVGEIALSMILVAAAGLLIKSFVAMQDVDLGFQPGSRSGDGNQRALIGARKREARHSIL